MKHIKTYESYRIKKNREDIIKESVLQVNDIYKVKTMIDIPQSLINAYVKKVKDTTGKNLRQFFGDVDIAEEIVKYINMNNLDVEKIPGGAIMGGGQSQAQTQTQVQTQTQPQMQTQVEPQVEPQVQPQVEPQAQAQTQPQVQVEAQPQVQVQGDEFEEVQPQSQDEEDSDDEEDLGPQSQSDEEELPL